MRVNNRKTQTEILSVILTIVFATAFIAALPIASAHTPAWQIPNYAYMSVTPNPVGVNQRIDIVMWRNFFPPTANGAYGDRWTGFTIAVTKPDGTTATLGPFTSDPVGSGYTSYTPDQTGTYKFVFTAGAQTITGLPIPPGQTINQISGAAFVNDTYSAAISDPVFLTVQTTQIIPYQETPLPTGYWTRPVYGANRNWYGVAASWLGGAAQRNGPTTSFGYGTGPESAHILWTLPYYSGGTMDARFGSNTYYTGMSYENYWSTGSTMIMNGKLYYNDNTNPRYGWYCVDLRKGTIDYFRNTTGPVTGQAAGGFAASGNLAYGTLSFGQIYNYDSPNQHGGFSYLWSTSGYQGSGSWDMIDQFSGEYICSIANTTQRVTNAANVSVTVGASGTQVYGNDGSITYYQIVNWGSTASPQYRLLVWNNTYAIWYKSVWSGNNYWFWRPNLNQTFNGANGYSLNVSIPNMANAGSIMQVREGKYVIGGTAGKNNGTFVQLGQLWALNLDPAKGAVGSLLWNRTYTPPQTIYNDIVVSTQLASYPYGLMAGPYVNPEDGVFCFTQPMTRQWWGYSLDTGSLLWGPTASEAQWNFYGMSYQFYQGKLLSFGYSGQLIAYDVKTGKQLWNWSSGAPGFENYYSGNAPLNYGCIADGKIYLYTSEHSPSTPLRRDGFIWCIDTTTGQLIWKIQGWPNGLQIGDGYLVGLDLMDNQIYCYGVGPSATTVTASSKVSARGSSVLIEGTVTDQSPGAKGTPAISDADQEVWMEYLYQQRLPMPTNVKGVPVKVTATDPNGNYQDLGVATSDVGGNFAISWTPPVEGVYHVTATFEGSAAYGNSYATTHFVVGPAAVTPVVTIAPTETSAPIATPTPVQSVSPSATNAPNPTSAAPTTTYIAIGAVVIIVVAAAAALILRRRK